MAGVQRDFPYHYLGMALYMRDASNTPWDYLSAHLVNRWQRTVNRIEDARIVNDKLEFFRAARDWGLPVAEVAAWSDGRGGIFDVDGVPLDAAARRALLTRHGGRLFAKPLRGAFGAGAQILETPEALDARAALRAPTVLQPVIRQHPELAQFHPTSVNSIRIATLDAENGPTIEVAALKMGCANAIVDNAGVGGVFAAVDVGTGRLRPFGVQRPRSGTGRLIAHPDTGARFEGAAIPFWPETCAAVLRGAEAFRPLGTLGWDVAITPEGPLIIEANAFWNATLVQIADGGLARTRLGRLALEHHRTGHHTARTLARPGPRPT